jgi:hypothetical protein
MFFIFINISGNWVIVLLCGSLSPRGNWVIVLLCGSLSPRGNWVIDAEAMGDPLVPWSPPNFLLYLTPICQTTLWLPRNNLLVNLVNIYKLNVLFLFSIVITKIQTCNV